MVTTLASSAGGMGSIPGQAPGPQNQDRKQKEYCNKFSKDVKQIAGVESLSPGLGVGRFGFAYGRCCVNLGRSCEFLRFLCL